jgi:hypothetical protein
MRRLRRQAVVHRHHYRAGRNRKITVADITHLRGAHHIAAAMDLIYRRGRIGALVRRENAQADLVTAGPCNRLLMKLHRKFRHRLRGNPLVHHLADNRQRFRAEVEGWHQLKASEE